MSVFIVDLNRKPRFFFHESRITPVEFIMFLFCWTLIEDVEFQIKSHEEGNSSSREVTVFKVREGFLYMREVTNNWPPNGTPGGRQN